MKTQNRTGKGSCDYCLDVGFVAVEGPDGQGYDEAVGPCPFCEAGHEQEFPDTGDVTSIRPPWGKQGFWRGRDTSKLVPLRKHNFTLSQEDQRTYLRAAVKELGFMVRDLNEEIEPGRTDASDVREVRGDDDEPHDVDVQHTDDLPRLQGQGDETPSLL